MRSGVHPVHDVTWGAVGRRVGSVGPVVVLGSVRTGIAWSRGCLSGRGLLGGEMWCG